MNKVRHILILCLFVTGLAASAQTAAERWSRVKTYEQVLRDNLWNGSLNINGVRQDTVSRSYAGFTGEYEGGGMRDTWQAERGWSAGASTASVQHLERMSLKGSFSFTQTEGYGMCGSMFIKPGFYPVDVLEFTPGRKTLQTYSFDGGISYDIAPSWRIGAVMEFESANIAKRKDLRHSNWRLDLKVTPGIMYHSDDFAAGAALLLRKTSETVEAAQVGTSESSYYAFLDKGQMYGVYSIWTGNGVHLDEAGVNGFPARDFSYGAALQAQYKDFFAETEYIRTSGSIGEKEYIWFRFPAYSFKTRLAYRHTCCKATHYARLVFGWNGRRLDESILEKVTANGVSTVTNHGSNRIATEKGLSLDPEYEYINSRIEVLAKAHIGIDKDMASQIYPYIHTQSLATFGADARVKAFTGPWTFTAEAGYCGGRTSEDSWMVGEQTGVQTAPYRLQDWYDRQMEFKTASRLLAGLSARYDIARGIYTELSGEWMYGFDLKYLAGPDRFSTTLTIGYDF